MRQLQVLDEARRLHVVGVREHEFLVLRRALALLGEFLGAQRVIDQRHRHRLALALAEHEAVAAGEARRLAVAALELVDHLAFGDRDASQRRREAEILDEDLDVDVAEADFADERMVAAVAALGGIGEAEQEAFVAARRRLQARVAWGGIARRVARDVGDRRAGLGAYAALDQVVAGDDVGDARHGGLEVGGCRRRRRRRRRAVLAERKVDQPVGVVESGPERLSAGQVLVSPGDPAAHRHRAGVDGLGEAEAGQGGAIGAH